MLLVKVIEDVRAFFKAHGITAEVGEGPAAREAQPDYGTDDGRVVFQISKNPIGIEVPQFIGDEPRQLWLTTVYFEVAFAGYDPENPESDLHHYQRCYDLWEATTQALQASYYGSYGWGSAQPSTDRKYARHGAEIVAVLAVAVPLFDVASPAGRVAPAPTEPKQLFPED